MPRARGFRGSSMDEDQRRRTVERLRLLEQIRLPFPDTPPEVWRPFWDGERRLFLVVKDGRIVVCDGEGRKVDYGDLSDDELTALALHPNGLRNMAGLLVGAIGRIFEILGR